MMDFLKTMQPGEFRVFSNDGEEAVLLERLDDVPAPEAGKTAIQWRSARSLRKDYPPAVTAEVFLLELAPGSELKREATTR